jgi:hypothetical protein
MLSPLRSLARMRPVSPLMLSAHVPALAAPLSRTSSLLARGTGFLFSRDPPPAPVLRSLESMANRNTADATWQLIYLQGLYQ